MQTFPWKHQSNITDSSPFFSRLFSGILTHALSTYSRIWSWWSWINRSDIPALRLRFSRISSWSQGWVKSKMLCPVSSTYRERHAASVTALFVKQSVFQNRWLSWNLSLYYSTVQRSGIFFFGGGMCNTFIRSDSKDFYNVTKYFDFK